MMIYNIHEIFRKMNKQELSILRTIENEILPLVEDIELFRYYDGITLKIYVTFSTLEKIIGKYVKNQTIELKRPMQFDEINNYPIKFYYKNKKYFIHLFKPYLEKYASSDINCLVKEFRSIDKLLFTLVKKIEDEELFKVLDVTINRLNIISIVEQKGNLKIIFYYIISFNIIKKNGV
jgi:hypothetical protein